MSLFGLVFSRLQVCPFLCQALETLSPGTLASSRRSHSPCSNLVDEGVADEVLLWNFPVLGLEFVQGG